MFWSFGPKLNAKPYQSHVRNLLKDVPSHLLQDLTPLMHPMLSNPPFQLCTNKGKANSEFEFHLSMKACSRCGEEGHQSSQCTSNCPNCNIKHPTGECPSSDITCFLCEISTHVPANCSMNHLVIAISKIKQKQFQLAAQVVKTSKEHDSHRKQQKARNKKKKERRIRRQENKPLAPSNLCYDLTL
jgi:hypothetical protein